jgi:hypothetical protein
MAWPTESAVWGVPRALEEEAGTPVPARFVALEEEAGTPVPARFVALEEEAGTQVPARFVGLEEAVLTFEIRRRWRRKMIE